jgi:hypothetical protein
VVGLEDTATPAAAVAADGATLDANGIRHRLITFAGGHKLDPDVLRQLADE